MWDYRRVERALFSWRKWTASIVEQWCLVGATPGEIWKRAGTILDSMCLPADIQFATYWVCCVASDCVIDDYVTYQKIVVPSWLPALYTDIPLPRRPRYKIQVGERFFPPSIFAVDVDYESTWVSTDLSSMDWSLVRDKSSISCLSANHELCGILKNLKGRLVIRHKWGRQSEYSDRISVECAVMKDIHRMTYVEIAREYNLPITENHETGYWQSDTARHLVSRGRELIHTHCR
jgi:hypothetical protein